MGTTLSLPQSIATVSRRRPASSQTALQADKPQHQPQLDGVRGLAILAVLASHAATVIGGVSNTTASGLLMQRIMTPGWGGVDLFFVLSGYLITGILLRTRTQPGYFRSFYARRALRIFPIYYGVLIVSLLVCTQVPGMQAAIRNSEGHLPGTIAAKLSFFVYLQNIPGFWPSMGAGLTGLWGAYWSLAVEEQFYLLWPTVIRFVRERGVMLFCVAAVCAGPLIRALVTHATTDTLGLLQFPVTRLDGLFAGAALAIYQRRRQRPLPFAWALGCVMAGAALLGYIAAMHPGELTGPKWWMNRFGPTAFVLFSVGLTAMTQLDLPGVRGFLSLRPLRAVGRVSYGVYIYHPAVFLLAGHFAKQLLPSPQDAFLIPYALLYYAAAAAVAMGLAACSYRWVECPFLRLKDRFKAEGTHAGISALHPGPQRSLGYAEAATS